MTGKLAKPASRMTKKELVAELCCALHERNKATRRLAAAEALLRQTVHPTQVAVIPPGWVEQRDAFLSPDSASHRENERE